MIEMLIEGLGLIACGGVLVGTVCRIDKMGWGKTKMSWFLMYLGFGAWACGIAIDIIRSVFVDWYTYAGLFASFGMMLLTMKDWKRGPPEDVKTQPGELM